MIELLDQLNINYSESGKHHTQGWVQVHCPYCDTDSTPGGIHLSKFYFHCWRCGWQRLSIVLSELSGIPERDIKRLLKKLEPEERIFGLGTEKKDRKLTLPHGTANMRINHYRYLKSRKFSVPRMIKYWKLMGINHLGPYKFRIIAPIYLDGVLVSYQGRDITGKSPLKYKACSKDDEVIHHKHIVYGMDHVKNRKACIVEGITDVWRIGPGCVATFGMQFTPQQVYLLAQRLDEAWILFDAGDTEQEQAKKLAYELTAFGIKTSLVLLDEGDPADMNHSQVTEIRELLK